MSAYKRPAVRAVVFIYFITAANGARVPTCEKTDCHRECAVKSFPTEFHPRRCFVSGDRTHTHTHTLSNLLLHDATSFQLATRSVAIRVSVESGRSGFSVRGSHAVFL